MTCQAIQNRILALPDPSKLPEPLQDHVATCASCQLWWKQAVQIEVLLRVMPTPPAPVGLKATLLEELTSAGPIITSIPSLNRGRSIPATVRYLAGLAAAIAVVAGIWSMTRTGKAPEVVRVSPRHSFLDRVVQRDVALAKAKTPTQRLNELSGLADDLSKETTNLARIASEEELRDLTDWFRKVVVQGIIPQADQINSHSMSIEQKRALFDSLSSQLTAARQRAEDIAKESPPHTQRSLKRMAETARDGELDLRAILARGGS